MATPYIPSRDADFNDWILNFEALFAADSTTYGFVSGDAVPVTSATSIWSAAYALATNPLTRTSATVAAKDSARASAEFVIRPIAVAISLNPDVSNDDKIGIGVTVRSQVPTPIPAPVVAPVIALLSAIPLVQQLQISPVGSTGKAKPSGCIAIEVARSVGVVAATDPAQLQIVGQFGKTPLFQGFSSEDQGKIVTYAARYRTRSGPAGVSQAGPWSALANFVVM